MPWVNVITIATGILVRASKSCGWGKVSFTLAHLSISVSLNVLLTLMIVIRLVLHGRNIRAITGSRAGIGGLYTTIATMLIESSALYAVNSLLLIGLWAAGNSASGIFMPALSQTQVRALLQPLNGLSNVVADSTGDCATAHNSTSCQPERVDEQHYRQQADVFVPRRESGGIDGRRSSSHRRVPNEFGRQLQKEHQRT